MRDMKSSSTSSRQIQKSPSSTFDGAEGGGGNNGLDGCASSSSTLQAGDLDAFFSTTTTTTTTRQTHTQTQTTTRQYQQHTTSTKNGVHQNDTFMDELAAFTSTPAPPSSSTSVFVHKRADASEVKNMAASSASATTNSSIDDLFGMSSDAQSSSPVETEHRKTQMTMETQATGEIGFPSSSGRPCLRPLPRTRRPRRRCERWCPIRIASAFTSRTYRTTRRSFSNRTYCWRKERQN